MFNAIAMLAAKQLWLTVCNCTFVSATVCHNNYGDIGTIKIDSMLTISHAGAITAIHSSELTALAWFE